MIIITAYMLLLTLTNNSGASVQKHVIFEEQSSSSSRNAYAMRNKVSTDSEISDNLELALVLEAGQFCYEALSEVLNQVYERENIIVRFSRKHRIARTTADPSEVFLDHCKRIIERKFVQPNFGGMIAMDLNESYEDQDLLFKTHIFAIPVFINTDDVEPPSNEVHLFVLEIITYDNTEEFEEPDAVANKVDFFLDQGHDKDNTWVGIDEYADIDDSYLLPIDASPESETDDRFSKQRSSTAFLNDHSTWSSLQQFMTLVLREFSDSIAYRMYEMIGVKDKSTDRVTFNHPGKILLGIPTRKMNT